MKRSRKLWAVITRRGSIVHWKSHCDGEEGYEIHRTQKIAESYRMKQDGERVVPIMVSWRVQ
jgi:hypothetical protein